MPSRLIVMAGAAAWVVVSVLAWTIIAFFWAVRSFDALPVVAPSIDASYEVSRAPEAIPDRFGRGDTLSSVLDRNGFTSRQVHDVARALSGVMNVRHLRAGDELAIYYDASGEPVSVTIARGNDTRIAITRFDVGWQSESEALSFDSRTVALTGVLEDNLFLSISRLGESAPLTVAFANVFAWDFDFHTQSREGDRFSLVVEKLYRDGQFIRYGDLKAARYVSTLSAEREFAAFLYQDPSGKRDYYDPEGKSMRKAFLRAPLDFVRISSGFSHSRLHPVHNRRMPHLGVDYAARVGTPVYSVASGVVTGRNFTKGGGNMVTVQHAMGYMTKYLHLSKFASGLRVGQRVEQKEVIGYVGATGIVTGPHLDFRLYRHGKAVNPVTQIFPPGPPVADEYFSEFEAVRAELSRWLHADGEAVPIGALGP